MTTCYICGGNKKLFLDNTCQVCGGYGLQTFCFSTVNDNECLFEPSDKVEQVDKTMRMSKLLANIGAFASISDADRNGWKNKTIPTGWSDFHIGKRPNTKRVCIWNPDESI